MCSELNVTRVNTVESAYISSSALIRKQASNVPQVILNKLNLRTSSLPKANDDGMFSH